MVKSNFALVSKRWRHRTNAIHFSVISVSSDIHRTHLQKLAGLFTSNIWSEHEGIAQYCHTFSFCPDREDYTARMRSSVKKTRGRLLSRIIGYVFLTDVRHVNHAPNQFVFGEGYSSNNHQPLWKINFDTLLSEVKLAITTPCANPQLTNISVSNTENLPTGILCSPTLAEIHLYNVDFIKSGDGIDIPDGWIFPNLQILKLDMVPLFVETIVSINKHFPQLSRLVLANRTGGISEDFYTGLYSVQNLEELSLTYEPCELLLSFGTC